MIFLFVVEAQIDYHKEMWATLKPGVQVTTSANIITTMTGGIYDKGDNPVVMNGFIPSSSPRTKGRPRGNIWKDNKDGIPPRPSTTTTTTTLLPPSKTTNYNTNSSNSLKYSKV